MKTFLKKVVIVTGVALFSITAAAEVKIIVHPSVSEKADANDVAGIFLGRLQSLPGGTKVVPVDQSDELKVEFYKKIAKRDQAQLKAYWSRLIFTGKGHPPQEMGSDAEVIRFVANNPDAIGYVSGNAQLKGVKVLMTAP